MQLCWWPADVRAELGCLCAFEGEDLLMSYAAWPYPNVRHSPRGCRHLELPTLCRCWGRHPPPLGRLCSWLQPFWASLLRQWCNRVWIYYPDLDTVNWDLNSISIFESKDDLKWEKFELQNCRSRRKLQFAYKFYPHPSSYQKKLWFFWREVVLAATGNYGRNPLAAAGWNGPFSKMVRGYFYKFLNLLYIFEKS